jgi:hypothetical protein
MKSPLTQNERRKQEAAEKLQVIEGCIELQLETLGDDLTTRLWTERKTGLKTLTLEALRQLDEEVQACPDWHRAHTLIVRAICASRDSRQAAEDARFGALCGSAKVEFF